MNIRLIFILLLLVLCRGLLIAQSIADFTSITPASPTSNFIFPASHRFQKIIEHGDEIQGGNMSDNFDFTGYIPISASSKHGYLSINHELSPGGVTIMNIQLDTVAKLWNPTQIQNVDFSSSSVNGTSNNCSGTVTPWGNIISCEETVSTADSNMDGYYDIGWHVEIDPANRQVVGKRWALGNGPKENMVVHNNQRTVYFGNDSNPGYLFKFVANSVHDLSSGILYVYTGPKTGTGSWAQLSNTTVISRNTTMTQAASSGATVFNGIEDVEIGPDGKVYFAVKNESCIYRFNDSDPLTGTTTSNMEIFAGNASYTITTSSGNSVVPWGTGNDNLAFDSQGNLWVLQDGDNNYIWVVMSGHTQAAPNVKIFGIAPSGSEPTGITFSPDNKYLFLSFQHPSSTNNADYQEDAAGHLIGFDKDIAIVIALSQNLGCSLFGQTCNDNTPNTTEDTYNHLCVCQGIPLVDTLTLSVSNGNDDAEENRTTGTINTTSSDLEMVFDGTTQQAVGIRFNSVPVVKNSYIENAYIQFTVDEVTSSTTNVWIHGEKTDNALPYNPTSLFSISARATTNDSITWTIPPWTAVGLSGNDQKTPDISALIREIIAEPDWQSGNAMSFVIQGTGSRVADSYEGGSNNAPRLVISYRIQNVNNVGIGVAEPESKLQVKDGDVFLETIGSGVILKSPDGTCWKVTVNNSGTLISQQVVCPQ